MAWITISSISKFTTLVRSSLEERILLARRSASALATIHEVKWLHKAISSFSIIHLKSSTSSPPAGIPPRYIVGFNHSRLSGGPRISTHLKDKSQKMKVYKHPEYANDGDLIIFQAQFDYYSLGMVLPKIGL